MVEVIVSKASSLENVPSFWDDNIEALIDSLPVPWFSETCSRTDV